MSEVREQSDDAQICDREKEEAEDQVIKFKVGQPRRKQIRCERGSNIGGGKTLWRRGKSGGWWIGSLRFWPDSQVEFWCARIGG